MKERKKEERNKMRKKKEKKKMKEALFIFVIIWMLLLSSLFLHHLPFFPPSSSSFLYYSHYARYPHPFPQSFLLHHTFLLNFATFLSQSLSPFFSLSHCHLLVGKFSRHSFISHSLSLSRIFKVCTHSFPVINSFCFFFLPFFHSLSLPLSYPLLFRFFPLF